MDMGPYYVTALINLLGGVDKITGVTQTSFPKRAITSQPHCGEVIDVDVPTTLARIMHFDRGVLGTIYTTFDVHYRDQCRFEIYGTNGTMIVPDPNGFGGPIKVLHCKDGEYKEMPLMFDYRDNSRALGLADMAKALETGKEFRAGYQQTLHVLEILTSFDKSSRAGTTINLSTHFGRKEPMGLYPLFGVLE